MSMKNAYDVSKGERGKIFSPDAELNISECLEPDVVKVFLSSTGSSIPAGYNEVDNSTW